MNCQISEFGREVSSPSCSCKDLAVAVGSHGIPGTVYSQGSSQDAPSVLATEDILVGSF